MWTVWRTVKNWKDLREHSGMQTHLGGDGIFTAYDTEVNKNKNKIFWVLLWQTFDTETFK